MSDLTPDSQLSQRASVALACLTLLAAGTAVYFNSLHAAFVFDDERAIEQNPTIRQLLPLWTVLSPPPEATVAGRPLVNLSLAINMALDQHLFRGGIPSGYLRVVGFHIFNLAVHLLAGLTLFGLVRRTYRDHVSGEGRSATSLALFAALLWTVHPLQTEAVTYTVQRAESMCGLFYLLTLYCTVRGADTRFRSRAWWWYGGAWAACLAGMASKEVMVSAPAILALYDRVFLAPSWREVGKRRWGLYVALAATWLVLAYLVVSAGDRAASAGFGRGVSAWQYAQTQFGVIVHYLRLCFWPRPLVFDYGDHLASTPAEVWPYAGIIAALLAATLVALWRWPKLGFLGVVFFAYLAPSSSVVPIVTQTAAEHRMYLASAAVIVLVVAVVHTPIPRLGDRAASLQRLAACIAAIIAFLLGCQTVARNRDYVSAYRLWQDTVQKNPRSARAHRGLCQALLDAGLPRAAIGEGTRALELHEEPAGYLNRGTAYLAVGELDNALADFDASLKLDPDDARAWYNRGLVHARLGQSRLALDDWSHTIALSPDFAAAWLNRGILYADSSELGKAESDFNRVIELEPRAADAYLYRADVRFRQKRYAPAWDDVEMAEQLGAAVDPAFKRELKRAIRAGDAPQ
ncbi:MAG TPA: tetratricopeptide repeat protein [Pirellulales bacterium]|nr:tetratricopeptide repeat protein [Pirellulales bacterium]